MNKIDRPAADMNEPFLQKTRAKVFGLEMRNCWAALTVLLIAMTSCTEVHDEHLVGPYSLSAIDLMEQMAIYYNSGSTGSGRIEQTVFSVGWNERYIVAKQHPGNDRRITNYYFLDMSKDSAYVDPSVSVTGPLTEAEFLNKQAALGLPPFRRTIRSLE